MKPRYLAALPVLLLGACTGPTPYQPISPLLGTTTGYEDTHLEANRFRVVFKGNTATPRETVEDYLLFRAAEITLESGNDFFITADRDIDKDTTYYSRYAGYSYHLGYFGYGHGYGGGFYYPFYYEPYYDAVPVTRYTAYADILVFLGAKPADDPNAYDARELIANLRPRLVLPVPDPA